MAEGGHVKGNEENTWVLLGPARLRCAEAESPEWHVCHPIDVRYNKNQKLNICSKILKFLFFVLKTHKSVSLHFVSPSPGRALSGKSDKTLCSSSAGNEQH